MCIRGSNSDFKVCDGGGEAVVIVSLKFQVCF